MDLRLACMDDLPQLKAVYENIIDNMNKNNISIWDEIYPCEFFSDDIQNKRFYILLAERNEIIAGFALCASNAGENSVNWSKTQDKALYLDRLGVNVNYLRKGIGSTMITYAIALAKENGAKYLRLFAVDINEPAINLYVRNGFQKVDGIYDESIDDDIILHEYGFEIELSESYDLLAANEVIGNV